MTSAQYGSTSGRVDSSGQVSVPFPRGRRGFEKALNRVLDTAFRGDESRVRKIQGPENLAILRHIAVKLLKQERPLKGGIKPNQLNAAYDREYLLKVLS